MFDSLMFLSKFLTLDNQGKNEAKVEDSAGQTASLEEAEKEEVGSEYYVFMWSCSFYSKCFAHHNHIMHKKCAKF